MTQQALYYGDLAKVEPQAPTAAAPIDTGMKHAPGIYFGMPEDEYHAIPALSASGIRNMMVSEMDFWAHSWMNPNKKNVETDAMTTGKAFHARIVEGKEAFYERYASAFDDSDYPNALKTADDIKEALADLGLKKTGKNKSELIERLREADSTLQIYDDLRADYEAQHVGKVFLSIDLIAQIEYAAAMVEKHPDLSRCFIGGYPEVTVIWYDRETGVPMKSRMDYLKIQAIIDLKTFSNPMGKPIDKAIYGSMASGRYHVQTAVYTEADKQAVQFAREGKAFVYAGQNCTDVPPETPLSEWLKKYARVEDRRFIFVFQQTGVAPIARGREMPRGLVYDCGVVSMRTGIEKFKHCLETFGTAPWVDTSPIEVFEDDQFPVYTTEA
jgi:hypothetical protein